MEHPAWLMWSGGIDEKTIDGWVEKCQKLPVQKATTFRTGDTGEEDDHRRTDIRWVANDDVYRELHQRVWDFAIQANQVFDLSLSTLPPLQFTEYSEAGHKYDSHHDIDWMRQDGRHRKLSVVVQLSDPEEYEGGELGFSHTQSPPPVDMMKKGTVIVFPSYHEHFVTPITSGHRKSLVGWIEGPRWR